MALPHRKQMLARFIPYHNLTRAKVAEILGIDHSRISNIIQGHAYPSPDEIDALEKLFGGMPASNFLDDEMLEYRFNWPPPRGYNLGKALGKAEAERSRRKAGE
ncbi:helix-turn-helix domain-containing protein [Mycetocola sp.]|uniref:helix-turn-helix domain-containing protein n=1 Tax=Mycetocola sp. TaxID=1871042 RepID=UPI003988B345